MGLGKLIKKAVKGVGKLAGGAAKLIGADSPDMPDAPIPAAQQVVAPEQQKADTDEATTSESDKKKTRARGKKSLSVARSSGGGLSI